MASSDSLLSEEQFMCSICLEVFIDPVSIPCGHNFCMACIKGYWNSSGVCQCPLCKETFKIKPELRVNTFISGMATQVKMLTPVKGSSTLEKPFAKPGEVPCDVCTGRKRKAQNSCLVCLASYCETHLEPHQIVPSFKRHKLIGPVKNLEDRVCKKHGRPLELFCRSDKTCVCQFCTETDHKSHKTVPIEEEFGVRKVQLTLTNSEVQHMIQERLRKVKETKQSLLFSRMDAEKEISDSVQVFNALVRSIERSQVELIEVIEEKQKAAERRAGGLIEELEQEITELQKRCSELKQLSHTEDHLHLLKSSENLCTLPVTKDWSEISVDRGLCVETVRRAVSQLEKKLNEEMDKLPDIKIKRMQLCAVNVTLDPDTANPNLVLSEDGKEVRLGLMKQNLPYNPQRFDDTPRVLGKEGFSSGRFYYEVQVKGKTRWVLGVARESINRKGNINKTPVNGYWTVGLKDGDGFKAINKPRVSLSLREKPQKVGVFVDYEEGEVSFYDVEARSHIYSFTGCTFTERLYPLFSTGMNPFGDNSAPLVICPINSTY